MADDGGPGSPSATSPDRPAPAADNGCRDGGVAPTSLVGGGGRESRGLLLGESNEVLKLFPASNNDTLVVGAEQAPHFLAHNAPQAAIKPASAIIT
jgi:hypothetical protein